MGKVVGQGPLHGLPTCRASSPRAQEVELCSEVLISSPVGEGSMGTCVQPWISPLLPDRESRGLCHWKRAREQDGSD